MDDPMQAFMRLNDLLGTYVPEAERTNQAEKDWQTVNDALQAAHGQGGEAAAIARKWFEMSGTYGGNIDYADVTAMAKAILAHPSASVPEGFRLVPCKPTEAMLKAAENYQRAEYIMDEFQPLKLYQGIYRAMLVTTPQPADDSRLKGLTHEKCGGSVSGRHVDGDPVACLKCGAMGEVLVDDGGIDIVFPNPPAEGAE